MRHSARKVQCACPRDEVRSQSTECNSAELLQPRLFAHLLRPDCGDRIAAPPKSVSPAYGSSAFRAGAHAGRVLPQAPSRSNLMTIGMRATVPANALGFIST
jgi:hypothetical protein